MMQTIASSSSSSSSSSLLLLSSIREMLSKRAANIYIHPRLYPHHSFFSATTYSSSSSSSSSSLSSPIQPNPSYVDLNHAPSSYLSSAAAAAVVYPSFLSPTESKSLLDDIQSKMKRRRYEKGHWDAVITTYKEVELPIPSDLVFDDDNTPKEEEEEEEEEDALISQCGLSEQSIQTIQRVRSHLETFHISSSIFKAAAAAEEEENRGKKVWLPSHAIDLAKRGELTAHVDSVKFSGSIVAGLSLLSDGIMRLKPVPKDYDHNSEEVEEENGINHDKNGTKEDKEEEEEGYIDLFLERGSLYVLSGVARYKYSHELLPSGSIFTKRGEGGGREDETRVEVMRDRRISVIFRDAKF